MDWIISHFWTTCFIIALPLFALKKLEEFRWRRQHEKYWEEEDRKRQLREQERQNRTIADPYHSQATDEEFDALATRLGATPIKCVFAQHEDGCTQCHHSHAHPFERFRHKGPLFDIVFETCGGRGTFSAYSRDVCGTDGVENKALRVIVLDASGEELYNKPFLGVIGIIELELGVMISGWRAPPKPPMRLVIRLESNIGVECYAATVEDKIPYCY